jgi:hypothetical protein
MLLSSPSFLCLHQLFFTFGSFIFVVFLFSLFFFRPFYQGASSSLRGFSVSMADYGAVLALHLGFSFLLHFIGYSNH